MVVVALASIFAASGEKANCSISRCDRRLSRDGAAATVASLARGGETT